MSNEWNDLERQLEQATARPDSSGGPLDPQTASLREAWLAFGQLLDAAQPASGKGTVPFSSDENRDSPPRIQPVPWPARHRRAWLVPAAVGVAASLLVAVTIAWMTRGGGDSQSNPNRGTATLAGAPGPTQPGATVPQPGVASQTELAWDDTLDKQIVLTGEAVLGAQEDWSVLADAANSVRYGIHQIQKDVQGSPL
jgi:hypothetical protein